MSFFTVLVTSKIAAGALAVGTLAAAGTAAAAYTGNLPAPLQQSAHNLIGAPAPAVSGTDTATVSATATPSPTATPVGPDATGPAAYGLCEAFTHGGLNTSSTAYLSLATAAKGTANIAAYCSTVVSPGQSASHRPSPVGTAPTNTARPAAPQLPAHAVIPAAPQLPAQATTSTPQPSTTGRP
ncbi:MAG: protein tyrosine phosphatase [Lacisediminihabitans sp.]